MHYHLRSLVPASTPPHGLEFSIVVIYALKYNYLVLAIVVLYIMAR